MRKCPKCGKEVDDASMFCESCGMRLSDENEKNPQQQTEPMPQNRPPEQKKTNKVYIAIIAIAVIIIIALLCAMCSSSDSEKESEEPKTVVVESTPIATAAPKPEPTPTLTPIYIPTPTPEPAAKEFIRENYGYVEYSELARNPDSYVGKSLTYSGKVLQVIEGDTETQHRIAVNGDYDCVIYVGYPKDIVTSRILKDDYVTVYGTSLGLYSYKSTMGGQITIPALYLDRIELQ